jgi:hypothetical protein
MVPTPYFCMSSLVFLAAFTAHEAQKWHNGAESASDTRFSLE